jgi:hypothetical protein
LQSRAPSLSCQSATVHFRLRSCQRLHVIAIVFSFISSPDPRSHPLNVLRIYGSSLDSRSYSSVSVSAIIVLFLGLVSRLHLFRHNLDFLTTVYSYLGISFFAFDIRCPCSPTCFFVPSLGPFYRRSTLRSILPPRLISDFLCPSQLLPLFNPYGLTMAGFKLLRFPVLFVGFVSFSSLRPPSSSLSPITLLPCVVVH